MSERTGIITRGTTIRGRSVNPGDVVTVDEDTFQKLAMTRDIQESPKPTKSNAKPRP